MADLPDLDLSSIPEWAVRALQKSVTPAQPKSALDYRTGAAWPLLLDAALVKTFSPEKLGPDAVKAKERKEAEKVVLNFAETTRRPDGKLEWSLLDETRVEILEAALKTDELNQAINRTSQKFSDDVSQALRGCVTEERSINEDLGLRQLEAARIAVGSLRGFSRIDSSAIEQLERQIEFRRLLTVFERMIGRRQNPDGTDKIERFFGRADEIEKLRDYVGVIPADSIRAGASRAINWLTRTINGRAPLALSGVGGAGKTTLLSKFMLEHAEAAMSRFPFAYLDFDRNTISSRRPSGLLMDMCLQVGAQFEQLMAPMSSLRARIGDVARKFEASQEMEPSTSMMSLTLEFRDLVDGFLGGEEGTFEFARPFLLVFDTFEVVQYADDDVVNLQDFVAGFSRPDENKLWNRLRLIISGRKEVTTFLAPVELLSLGALDEEGSVEMLMALAADANKPISQDEAEDLVEALVKATEEPGGGVQPLRLKLIGGLFSQKDISSSELVQSLITELNKPLEKGGLAAQILIDGILIRRVLCHVSNPRVRALSDPGLVVRRITPAVIKEVMARGTTKPAPAIAAAASAEGTADAPPSTISPPDDESDLVPFEPWIVDDHEAQDIFNAFAREVTLVEPDEDITGPEPEVAALRHRADVRQQMLPLIKLQRPNRFKVLHELAFDHFMSDVAEKKRKNENSMPSAAEAIYHGLWLNKPLEQLDELWVGPQFDPRIDSDEFEVGSIAATYLKAKSGGRLSASEVGELPSKVALNWLNQRSADLLEERRIDDAIAAIRSAAGENYEALGDNVATAAVLARLLYRAGFWQESQTLAERYLSKSSPHHLSQSIGRGKRDPGSEGLISLLRTSLTIEAKSGLTGPSHALLMAMSPGKAEPIWAAELYAHAILAVGDEKRPEIIPPVLRQAVKAVPRDRWKPEQRVMRLAILAGNGPIALFRHWLELRERVPREVGADTIIALFKVVFSRVPLDKRGSSPRTTFDEDRLYKELQSPNSSRAWNSVDDLWRNQKSMMVAAIIEGELMHAGWALLSCEHSDWLRPLGNALTKALKDNAEGAQIIKLLDKKNFWKTKTRSRQGREHDGVGVVQNTADEGRLLELAGALAEFKGKDRSKRVLSEHSYPENVFDLSQAFLAWHEKIVKQFRWRPAS